VDHIASKTNNSEIIDMEAATCKAKKVNGTEPSNHRKDEADMQRG
jgi:hypothetical protein